MKKKTIFALAFTAVYSAIGFSGGITAHAGEYQSNGNVWLRNEQSTDDEQSKICVIPAGTKISTTQEQNGWGFTTYSDGNTTYSGWTALYLYEPVQSTQAQASTPQSTQQSPIQEKIYSYLVNELGFNRASAIGIMTNVSYESNFIPTIEITDSNGLPSIGLFQWNGERCDNFKAFCNARTLEYGSVDAQLMFLKYELNNQYYQQYETMLNFSNTADGCYNAAYYWASKFEICTSDAWAERAQTAYRSY